MAKYFVFVFGFILLIKAAFAKADHDFNLLLSGAYIVLSIGMLIYEIEKSKKP